MSFYGPDDAPVDETSDDPTLMAAEEAALEDEAFDEDEDPIGGEEGMIMEDIARD